MSIIGMLHAVSLEELAAAIETGELNERAGTAFYRAAAHAGLAVILLLS